MTDGQTDDRPGAVDSDSLASLTAPQVEARKDDLDSGLAELAGLVAGALPLEQLLTSIAGAAVRAIPGADGAGVTLLRSDRQDHRVQSLGASTGFVAEIDAIQYELLDEGPCITAAADRAVIRSGSIGGDQRWPRFGPRVGRLGVHSVLCLPMQLPDGTVVGALNAFSRSKHAFDDDAARIGALFATPATVATYNAQLLALARTQAAQLQAALVSQTTIDQAIGIVRSRTGATADEAFARLVQLSQHSNVKLSAVAEQIVSEAVSRARARHTRP